MLGGIGYHPHVLRLATFEAYFGTQLIALVVKGLEFMLHKPQKLSHTQDMVNLQIISRTGIIIKDSIWCVAEHAQKETSFTMVSQLMQTTNLDFDSSLVALM